MGRKKSEEPKQARPCRKCGTSTREVYCSDCKREFRSWLGGVEERIFHMEWANKEARERAST
jgi:hypothetical protein